MHELMITQSILNIALKHAQNADHITDIFLKIGDLSSIVDESVQFYWDIISQDTPAQNAKLHFERIPATMRCLDCSECYQLRHRDEFTCPHCGGTAVQLVSGDEFCVEAIDVQIPAVNAIDSSC